MKCDKLILLAIVLLSKHQLAQQDYKPINSDEVIKQGIKLHDDEKYEEAISEFKKIQRNDSGFVLASVELVNTYLTQKKDTAALNLCNELLKQDNELTPTILLYKANALDNLKQLAQAEEVYKIGIQKYPMNNLFLYELGISKFRQEKYVEAYQYFLKSIKLNPLYAPNHLQMGNLAIKQGKLIPAFLAWQFYLFCDNQSKRSGVMIDHLEQLAKVEVADEESLTIDELKNEIDFSELESIFRSKIALSEKYKSKLDISYDVVKQMQLVCENINKYKNDVPGFYNSFYGDFFTNVWLNKYFESYVYSVFSGINNETITKWVAKNKKDIDAYENWAYRFICTKNALFEENLNGNIKKVPHWYSYGRMVSAGEEDKEGNNIGYWNYFFNNGIKKAEGAFIGGKKDGEWKYYYENGTIKKQITYKNGEEVRYLEFFENTNPKSDFYLKNNLIEGKAITYFSNGKPYANYDYVSGKINGEEKKFYKNGALQYKINSIDGKLNGDLIEYYDNGKIKQKCKFIKDYRQGYAINYYNNEKNTIKSEGNYIDNEANGSWKFYYNNEKLESEGNFNQKGVKDGLWKVYDKTGILLQELNYSDGKFNGSLKYYTKEGKIWEDFNYKKGKITEIKSYKENGELLGDHKLSGKSNIITLFYPDGTKQKEGLYKDGEMTGTWKTYNKYGVQILEETYKDGVLDGKYTSFHHNGKIKTETFYKNGSENSYFKSYYINGQLMREGFMVNDLAEGEWMYYSINGTIESKKYFKNGDIDGWNTYYAVNGKISTEDFYKLNCLTKVIYYDTLSNITQNIDLPGGNGIITTKHKNGTTLFHKEFAYDFPQGKSLVYYPNGALMSVKEYSLGKAMGVFKHYDEFGVISQETPYFNDYINGTKVDYHYNGSKESEFQYVNDELEGEGKVFYETGKLYRTINYQDDKAEGESFVYDETGELMYVRKYENDLLVGYSYNDASGKLQPIKKIEKGDFKVLCQYKNGKKSVEINYTNGDLNGKRILYNSNGSVLQSNTFYYDLENGESKAYYLNGNLKSVENYSYGKGHGISKYYYENGNLRKECNYINGTLHGLVKFYNEAGKLIKSILYYDGSPYEEK